MQTGSRADVISANIRAELARRRGAQADLAELLSCSQGAISDRMRGRTRFQIEELEAIAAFLEVPLEHLLATPGSDAKAVSA